MFTRPINPDVMPRGQREMLLRVPRRWAPMMDRWTTAIDERLEQLGALYEALEAKYAAFAAAAKEGA